jgi:TolA-binding protein
MTSLAEYSLSSFLPFIGKAVKDEYGRTIGNVISFTATPIGFVESVLVGYGGSEFSSYPVDNLKTSESTLILVSPTRSRASYLSEQLRQLSKKIAVLDDLKQKNTITQEAYSRYHSEIEQSITRLQTEADSITTELTSRVATIEHQLNTLRASFLDVEIARGTGEFESAAYETAINALTNGIKLATAEKEDLENLVSELGSWKQHTAKTEPESAKVLEVSVVEESSPA